MSLVEHYRSMVAEMEKTIYGLNCLVVERTRERDALQERVAEAIADEKRQADREDQLRAELQARTLERDAKSKFIEGLVEELGQVRELHGQDLAKLDELLEGIKNNNGG